MGGKERGGKPTRREVNERPRNPEFDRLFSKVLEVSRSRAEASTENTATVAFQIPPDPSLISVAVNPSFADEQGRPVFLTVDAYIDGMHVQQVSARATWSQFDAPTTEIDSTMVGTSRRVFETESLARMGIVAMKSLLIDKGNEKDLGASNARSIKYLN